MALKEGMGEKLAVVSNLVGTSIICLCTAFPLGWELTLACVSVMPFSIAVSIALTNVSLFAFVVNSRQYMVAKGTSTSSVPRISLHVITLGICFQYQTKSSMLEMESYSQAGKQAEEVLKSVRTIVAFNGENKEVDR